jgi:hypothetical protein
MQNKKLSDLLWGRFLVDRLSPSPADAALLSDDSQQDLLTPGFDLFSRVLFFVARLLWNLIMINRVK